jgi:hypothetical protein
VKAEERIEEIIKETEELVKRKEDGAILVQGVRLTWSGLGPISKALEGVPTPVSISTGWIHIADDVAKGLGAGPREVIVEGWKDIDDYYRPTYSFYCQKTKFPNVHIWTLEGFTAEGNLDLVVFISIKGAKDT